MKEKRYTLPEEQKDAAFAAEPAPAYQGNAAIALPEDECAEYLSPPKLVGKDKKGSDK